MMALTIILSYLLLFLSLLPLLLLLLSNILPSKKASPNLPPGPTNLPIVGSLHRLVGRLPHLSLSELSREHGPLMFLKLGSVPTVVASSAGAAREFLKTHDLDSCSRPDLACGTKHSYERADIVFAPYGARWRELRKVCIVEFFSGKRVAAFRPMREEEVARMVTTISSSSSSKSDVNISATLLSVSNDITCRSLLGRRYYDDGAATGEATRLHEILEETQAMLGGFFFTDYIPALGWLDIFTGMRARLRKNFSDLDSIYETVIDEHTDRARRSRLRSGGEDTVDALLRIQKDTGDVNKENIKGLLMNIFIGGSETSSTVVEWAMSELMRNPRAMKKAQDEVRALVGSKGKVEESDLRQLHYLKCVLKEVMRLHPPLPLLVHRETMQPFKIDGFDIPARTRVMINAWAIGRDEASWETPGEFVPERFAGGSCGSIDLKGHDFELIPFGAGRRICPGICSGLVVVELALANLLYSFNWELPEGVSREDLDMEEAVGITVHRKSPLRLVASKWSFT